MEAVLDDGDVEVDDVAGLEPPLAGDAVADHVIDRRTDGLREALVVERGGYRILVADDKVVAEAIQFVGRDARLDMPLDHVEDVGRKPPGQAHARLFLGGLDRHAGFSGHQHGFRVLRQAVEGGQAPR